MSEKPTIVWIRSESLSEKEIFLHNVKEIIEKTFAPAINFKAPYAKLMRDKAAEEVLALMIKRKDA